MSNSPQVTAARATAALIVDMQSGFGAADGALAPGAEMLPVYQRAITEAAMLAEAARARSWPVVLMRHLFREGYPEMSNDFPFRDRVRERNALRANSSDAQFVAPLRVEAADIVIDKRRFDSFLGTDLDLILRAKEIKRVIVAGVSTNVCVESTVRSASERGYNVVVARDATAAASTELHQAALRSMAYAFATVTDWRTAM